MKTELLYRGDSVLTFGATVIAVTVDGVELDRTAFFARAGGRVGDTGILDSIAVSDTVVDRVSGNPSHLCGEGTLHVGQHVIGHVDEQRRQMITLLHSAQHLAYFGFIAIHGQHIEEGGLVAPAKARVDFLHGVEAGPIHQEELANWINGCIQENRPVSRWQDPNRMTTGFGRFQITRPSPVAAPMFRRQPKSHRWPLLRSATVQTLCGLQSRCLTLTRALSRRAAPS